MTSDTPPASEGLAELVGQREQARARLDAIEAEQRAATAAVQGASEQLVALERAGGPATEKKKLEVTLAAAQAKANEPWAERAAGGRAAIRDADAALRAFAAAHLSELVGELEAEGEVAATALNEAATALVAAYQDRERIASELAQLIATAGLRGRPGDITFSRAGEVATSATTLLREGGEQGPTWRNSVREEPAA